MSFGQGNLQQRVAELERENGELRKRNRELRDEITEDAYSIPHLAKRIDGLEAENAKLKERLKLRPHDLMHRLDELEHMVETRGDSIRYLVGIVDKRQERIKELELLVNDMSKNCRPCTYSCFTDRGVCGIYERISETRNGAD